ncbi:bifunctional 4-alpha-glucanotransferase/amylo-alpha-1,6-glucosidase [Spiromyces aspiralis]|uniref:Bifunctional 4-alpha-glucanotransferase/amylo-alpha-1,6-glucosidase n=1 Tax=Spiromyces aspiralis TaxID=68401 RepID=A0ACC1HJL0_9FUNG|nr:bifunctional 4-alpha-glucanotransferase/amylo-alpha-1,6-glucosidase [Spiromyces aspiralis]
MARLFHGFRIDNCHSTPIELAEFLLDEARVVRPNLYLIAELFTGSEDSDRIFVSRLGLNSLVRESMQAWDPHELSRVIHRNGGVPVGSMDLDCLEEPGVFTDGNGLVTTCVVAPIRASLPHAIFFDCTHDNKTPFQLRQACDALPNAALVAMTACAVGSNKGYDELYSYLLDVVNEQRRYLLLDDPLSVGIGKARRALNEIHREMASYQEIHVHHEGEFITVHRQHPVTRNGYLLVAHCAFPGARDNAPFSNARLYGTVAEAVLSYRLVVEGDGHEHDSDGYLHGLPATLKELAPPPLELGHDEKGPYTELRLPEGFGPGSILLVRTRPEGFPDGLEEIIAEGCEDAVSRLGLGALNAVLYRCSSEEHDTVGSGVYDVPGLGSLAYAGLQGWVSHLQHIIPNNDLGHSLCAHLRSGHWALDYITNRLEKYQQQLYPELSALTSWFAERFSLVKQAPSFLTPKYFAMVVTLAYKCAVKRALSLMSPEITGFSDFGRRLALTSVQMVGATTSCSLRPFDDKKQLSMAAGLPHFTTHHMRCWGRDIFISLEGLLMKTGRHDVARDHILAFGSTLKHGLIPNLLDSGRYPRYNARDATWFWLKAVQDYCRESAEGLEFLGVEVDRRFQADDTFAAWDEEGRAYARKSTVAELVQEIMQAHARGISFREWNAGPALDQAMRDEGFNIDIYVDWRNGLVKGGNDFNCGTWMDKMGDSDKAGIRGIPGSPRDGADIEIIGLLKYTVSWLTTLATEGSKWFPYKGVSALMAVEGGRETTTVTYEQWSELLKANFEKGFYVPEDEALDAEYHVKSELVNQRGIYRDTVEATREWADYQFRPNIPVAMVVAPELFDPNHARTCLKKMGQVLCGPLGMRTLDPRDMRYRPYYDNSNDSDDPTVAHGINYHAGPEWVWCMGYYLQALLIFFSRTEEEKQATLQEVHRHLLPLARHIATTQFAGLPELTNLNGTECPDSCPTQAWSAATIITLLSRMNKM